MATISEALSRRHTQTRLKAYIKNNSDVWVDFSDRFTNDRLESVGTIRHQSEGPHGKPTTPSVSISADNTDRYWDDAVPTEFDPWGGRDVQIRLDVADASEATLGTFRIASDGGIQTDLSNEATIKLESFYEVLDRVDADSVKHGQEWYQNRPFTFLLSELIRAEFHDSAGDLPSGTVLPTDPRWTFPDGNKHLSAWGKPPQWDGTDWNSDNADTPWCIERDSVNDKLWVGIGANLWEYDIATDTWTDRGEHATNGAGVNVRAVYLCTAGLVVCKWDEASSSPEQHTLYVNFWDTALNAWDATTTTSHAQFFSGVFWKFDGAYETNTNFSRQIRGFAGGLAVPRGTNLPVPFAQEIRGNQSGGSNDFGYNSPASPTRPNQPFLSLTASWIHGSAQWDPLPATLDAGYWAMRGADAVAADLEVQVHYGNKPNIAWDRQDGAVDGYLYFVYFDGIYYKIKRLSITQGVAIASTEVLSSNFGAAAHSLTLSHDKAYLDFITFAEIVDSSGWDNTLIRSVATAAIPNAAVAIFVNHTTIANPEDVITDILYSQHTSALVGDIAIVKLKAARLGKFPQWQISRNAYTATTNSETIKDSSMGAFVTPRIHHGAFPLAYIDTQSGAVKTLDSWAAITPTTLDGGKPPVFDAPYCMDYRYDTGTNPNVYGISAPFHSPKSQSTTPSGKYYLWQHTTTHTGRLELADFDGLSKLDALSQICEVHRLAYHVDRAGDWIVKAKHPATAPTTTVARDHFAKGWTDLRRVSSAPIINFVEITPYESTLGEMETTLFQRPDSIFDGAITATQLDTRRRKLRMRCIHGGHIGDGATRWDILKFVDIIDTRLGAAYVSGTSVTLESVHDVEVGDTIQVSDSEARDIASVTAATKIVTIDTAFTSTFSITTSVKITKSNQEKWSSAGVTTLNGALTLAGTSVVVDSGADVGVGNFIIVEAEEMQVTAKSNDGLTLTVTRGDNNATHADGLSVGMIVKPSDVGKDTLVGNHSINVRFETNTNEETPVATGDYLEFICPGLKLDKVKHSKITTTDQSSIDNHGKRRPKRRIDNRFLTAALAEFVGDSLVTRYPAEKKRFEITMPMDIDYFTLDTLTLKSAEFLPSLTDNELNTIVMDIAYMPTKGAGRTVYNVEQQ